MKEDFLTTYKNNLKTIYKLFSIKDGTCRIMDSAKKGLEYLTDKDRRSKIKAQLESFPNSISISNTGMNSVKKTYAMTFYLYILSALASMILSMRIIFSTLGIMLKYSGLHLSGFVGREVFSLFSTFFEFIFSVGVLYIVLCLVVTLIEFYKDSFMKIFVMLVYWGIHLTIAYSLVCAFLSLRFIVSAILVCLLDMLIQLLGICAALCQLNMLHLVMESLNANSANNTSFNEQQIDQSSQNNTGVNGSSNI